MKKLYILRSTLLTFVLTYATMLSSHASNKIIECIDVGNEMSWYVTLSSDLSIADHFDNDHETALGLSKTFSYDPPQPIFEFVGKDGSSPIKFLYEQATLSGTMIVEEGTANEFQVQFECNQINDKGMIDWSAVQAALDNAKKNRGSTRMDD